MEYCIWKRDEAVLSVREGSIVVGASRYEPRLRCTKRVDVQNVWPHHRHCGTSEVSFLLLRNSYPLAPATTLPSPQTSESWRRICTPLTTQQYSTDASPVRSRSRPPLVITRFITPEEPPPSPHIHSSSLFFGALQPQPLLEVIHSHPHGSPRPHHGDPCVVPRGGAHAASVVPA